MKCICSKKCQARLNNGKIKFFMPGETADFEECPTHFLPVDAYDADFQKSTEEALMASKWKKAEAIAFIEECGATYKETDDKADLVSQIIDARYRKVD